MKLGDSAMPQTQTRLDTQTTELTFTNLDLRAFHSFPTTAHSRPGPSTTQLTLRPKTLLHLDRAHCLWQLGTCKDSIRFLLDQQAETCSTTQEDRQVDKRCGDGIGAVGGHLEWSVIVAISCQGVGVEVSVSITCVMTIIG